MRTDASTAQSARVWRVKMLGGLEVACEMDSVVVRQFRTRRAALLIAYLAMKPGAVKARSQIGEMLWPEENPQVQRNRLRFELSTLRSSFGPSLFAADCGKIALALASAVTSDVAEFDQLLTRSARIQVTDQRILLLRQALTLYHGDLLPGLDLPDGCPPEFDWLSLERHRLREAASNAAVKLMTDLRVLGLHEEATRLRQETVLLLPEIDEITHEESHKKQRLPTSPSFHDSQQVVSYSVSPSVPLLQGYFVGREAELLWLRQWANGSSKDTVDAVHSGQSTVPIFTYPSLPQPLSTLRLITLVGTGGIGKTRLLTEALVGHTHAIMVPLSGISDKVPIYDAITLALSLMRRPGLSVRHQVVEALRVRPEAVLLLDNCEHLVGAVAACVTDLLEACPQLRVIATSQHALMLETEQVLTLLPLQREDSLALFLNRAQAVQPNFAITSADKAAAEAVVDLLGGIPLALELAAARAVILGPKQIRDQLSRQITLLASAHPGRTSRHRSMRAVLQWSTGLLSDNARCALGFLSLFRTGATLEALQAVIGESETVFDALEELCIYSLLIVQFPETDDAVSKTRYDVLFHVRKFAAELLTDTERNAGIERHSEFWTRQVNSIPNAFHWGQWETIRTTLVPDIENIRAAIDGCVRLGLGLALYRLSNCLGTVLLEMGYWNDAENLFIHTRETGQLSSEQLVRLLGLQGALYRRRGSEDEAYSIWRRSLDLVRTLGDADIEATILFDLAGQSIDRKEFTQAWAFVESGIAVAKHSVFAYRSVVGTVLSARLCMVQEQWSEAIAWAESSWAALSHVDANPSQELYVLIYLLPVFRACGDDEKTRNIIRRALPMAIETGQAFLLARLLDEAVLSWEASHNYEATELGLLIAREIHTELGSRFRKQSLSAWETFSQRKADREGSRHISGEMNTYAEVQPAFSWQQAIKQLRLISS